MLTLRIVDASGESKEGARPPRVRGGTRNRIFWREIALTAPAGPIYRRLIDAGIYPTG
jgi:hypothetical protein